MNSVLTALRRLFGRRISEPPHVRSPLDFPQLDVEEIKTQLKLDEQGRRQGAHNIPPSDTDHYDDIEQKIIETVKSEEREATRSFGKHSDTHRERISTAFAQLNDTANLNSPLGLALSRFKSSLNNDLGVLVQLQQKVRENEEDVDTFKREHDLDRAPHYPESRLMRWGVIVIILLVEAILNGSFLARGNELGLVGGIFEAVVIALINVAFGLCVGWKVAPECNHRRRYRRIFGLFGLFAYVVGVFGFNLAVAHYRTALGSDAPENAARLAFETLTATPFLVEDMQSWLLFLLGCVFSGVAAIDGWGMDDPYPGYGTLDRLKDEARNDFQDQRKSLFRELDEIRNTAISEMEEAAKNMKNSGAEHRNAVQGKRRFEKSFQTHLDHLDDAANTLLRSYRDANKKARKTKSPQHFSEAWKLDRSGHEVDEAIPDEEMPKLADKIAEVNSRLEKNCQKLIAEYDKAVAICRQRLTES